MATATATGMLPVPGRFASGAAKFGVPAIAGIGGFVAGDVFAAEGYIASWFPQTVEGNLPFSGRLNYTAALTMIPYGIALAIVQVLSSVVPGDGAWWHVMVFRSARWFLIGIVAHLALEFLGVVAPGAAIGLPALVR